MIEFYFQVIPQLIARIDTPRQLVGRLIHQLLSDVGKQHPQVRNGRCCCIIIRIPFNSDFHVKNS